MHSLPELRPTWPTLPIARRLSRRFHHTFHRLAPAPLTILVLLRLTAQRLRTATRTESLHAGVRSLRSPMRLRAQRLPRTPTSGASGCIWHPTKLTTRTAIVSLKGKKSRLSLTSRAARTSMPGETSLPSLGPQIISPPLLRWSQE